jgi:hypothetical protein
MPITITGTTIRGGVQMYVPPPPPSPIYDLDAANFAALPVVGGSVVFNGSTQS